MGESSVLTLRLEPGLKRQLDKLAQATRRSRSYLAAEAIREYVTLNEWQVAETRRAVAEADRGEFASEREVQRTMSKWARRAR
jgi:RHH-type rel operon transcriptional repressor/antitoxin RelB